MTPPPTTIGAPLPHDQMVLSIERSHPSWAVDLIKYMVEHKLPDDNHEAQKIARQAKLYTWIDNELYRQLSNGVKLRHIPREDKQDILSKIHQGVCSNNVTS